MGCHSSRFTDHHQPKINHTEEESEPTKTRIFDRDCDKVVRSLLRMVIHFDLGCTKIQTKIRIIQEALALFPSEINNNINSSSSSSSSKKKNSKRNIKKKKTAYNHKMIMLGNKLESFMSADDPFEGFDFDDFKSVCEQLREILHVYMQKKDDAGKRLRSARRRRKICSIIYTLIMLLLLLSQPMMVNAAVSAAARIIEQWMDSLWDQKEKKLASEVETLKSICNLGKKVYEIDNIRILFEKVKADFDSISSTVDFALADYHHKELTLMRISMAGIKSKIGVVESDSRDLKEKVIFFSVKLEAEKGRLIQDHCRWNSIMEASRKGLIIL